jgi:1-aminocyclopropane-1-carboxylate deaminase/D-cysteine desulfhydrase-like pyridoxal-dependent ACC family enzyme
LVTPPRLPVHPKRSIIMSWAPNIRDRGLVSAYPTPELFRSFPELREKLPWVSLARATQVAPLGRLESYLHAGPIWVKRDDQTSEVCGGDKARKLEFLFGDLLRRGARRIVSVGPAGNGYSLAVTAFAHQFRVASVLGLVRGAAEARRAIEIEHALGAELHRLDGGPRALWRFARSVLTGRRDIDDPRWPYLVRPGRARLYATLGYVNAAHELKRQINCGILPEPERIYVPLRSGAQAAGLLLGCSMARIRSRIVGVAATTNTPSVPALAYRAARALSARTRRFRLPAIGSTAFELRRELAGARGSAAPIVHSVSGLLRDLEGLSVDSIYGARAIAVLAQDLRERTASGPVLFWHAPASGIFTRHPARPEALPREVRALFVARS